MLRYQQVHRFESPIEDALRAAGARRPSRTPGTPRRGSSEAARNPPEAAEAGRRAIEDERTLHRPARSAIWVGKEHVFVDRI